MSTLIVVRTPGLTTIPNAALRDATLSFRARGILAFLLSNPSDWETKTSDLSGHGTEGRDAVRTGLAELRTAGYVVQYNEKYLGPTKKMLWKTITVVKDDPALSVPTTDSQSPEPPATMPPSEDGFSGAPLLTTSTSTSNPSLDTSYLKKTTESLGRKVSKTASRRQQAIDAQAADDASDPDKIVWGNDADDDAEPTLSPGWDGVRKRIPAASTPGGKRRVSLGPAHDLAQSFLTYARSNGITEHAVPGPLNVEALANQFAQWRREGTTNNAIRQMMDTYWSPEFQRSPASPAWQDFLAQRGGLKATVDRHLALDEAESNRNTPGYWIN